MSNIKTFYVGVKSVIVNPKINKVLVLIKKNNKGYLFYDIPGGRINDDETIVQALERELKEEILNIKEYNVIKLISAYRLPFNLPDGKGLLLLLHKVESDITNVILSNEHIGYKWLTKDEINDLRKDNIRIEEGVIEALQLALS